MALSSVSFSSLCSGASGLQTCRILPLQWFGSLTSFCHSSGLGATGIPTVDLFILECFDFEGGCTHTIIDKKAAFMISQRARNRTIPQTTPHEDHGLQRGLQCGRSRSSRPREPPKSLKERVPDEEMCVNAQQCVRKEQKQRIIMQSAPPTKCEVRMWKK